jgi:hypothetical protein
MLSEKVKSYIENQVQVEEIKKNCENTLQSVMNLIEPDENGQYTVWVETLVSSHYGHYVTQKSAEIFGVEFTDGDDIGDISDDVDAFTTELSKQLNKIIDLPGKVVFGNHDNDGSYGVMYVIDADLVQK